MQGPKQTIQELLLADTKVSFAEVEKYMKSRSWMNRLDLSGLNITDEQLGSSSLKLRVHNLNLSRNPITDQGVTAALGLFQNVSKLDLSDTKVTGESLDSAYCPTTVKLDGTEVTDAVIRKLVSLPSWTAQMLSLRRTKITPAILPTLKGHGIALGEGLIKEKDLLELGVCAFESLKLNGPEFTESA